MNVLKTIVVGCTLFVAWPITAASAGVCDQLAGKRLAASVISSGTNNTRPGTYIGIYYFDFAPTIVKGATTPSHNNGRMFYSWYLNNMTPVPNQGPSSNNGGAFAIGQCAEVPGDPTRANVYARAAGETGEGNGYFQFASTDGQRFRLQIDNSLFAVNEVNMSAINPGQVQWNKDATGVYHPAK